MAKKKEPVFVEITNKDIYEELQKVARLLQETKDTHEKMISELKSRANSNTKMIIAGYGFSMAILGWLVAHLMY